MSMKNPTRGVRTPRKRRVWTTNNVNLAVSAGGTANQKVEDIAGTVEGRIGRKLVQGDTVGRLYVSGHLFQISAGDASVITCALGIVLASGSLDAGDFSDQNTHDGDPMLHWSQPLVENTAALGFLEPRELWGNTLLAESQAQRTVRISNSGLFVVAQTLETPSTGVTFRLDVTVLWLLGN